jgi:ABC-type sugar transport system ATPase subunit
MIETRNLTIQAGDFRLRDINITVPAGAYCAVMGKTGSGKTTLLEAICGLKQIVSGSILFEGRDITQLKPALRGIGFVPQDASLFETMNVRRHLDFALRLRRWSKFQIEHRVAELAELLEIRDLLDRQVHGLSGGERQRVALGRALSFRPTNLCLDEPLSALDDETRDQMIALLKHVQRETGVTALHVTHNQREASALADVRVQITDGEVVMVNGDAASEPGGK